MITIKVGDQIRKTRKQKNISQEELANRTGIDRTYISGVENGRRNISIINLEKIVCKGLGTNLSDFFYQIYVEESNGKK